MKKILVIGQFTDKFRKMNKSLTGKYEVRACVNKLEIFRGMFKLNEPDVVVLLIEELDKTNEELLAELKKEYKNMPVVCAGLDLENITIPDIYMIKQFEYLETAYTAEQLIEKIEYVSEKDLTEEIVEEKKYETENTEDKVTDTPEQKKEPEDFETIKNRLLNEKDRRKKIMLVDDSGIYLRMMKGLLDEEYDIIMTTSGLKAISMVHEKHPDLILLDYEMPLFDGRETMVKIRQAEDIKDIPIVFVTAVNDKDHIKAVLSLKPAGYLLKPIDKDRLFKTIKSIVGE